MRSVWLPLCAHACGAVLAVQGYAQDAGSPQGPEAKPPTGLQPQIDAGSTESWPSTDLSNDPNAPQLQMMITKSMLKAAGLKHRRQSLLGDGS